MKSEEGSGASEEKQISELDAMIRLHKLSALSVTENDLGKILVEIVDVAIDLTGANFGTIQLIDPISSALSIVAQRGFPQWWLDFWNSVSRGQGTCGVSVELEERVIVEDVEQSPIFTGTALEMQCKVGVRGGSVDASGLPVG